MSGCLIFIIIVVVVFFNYCSDDKSGPQNEPPAKVIHQAPAPQPDAEYPSITIGGTVWTKSNMNENIPGSFCYEDNEDNCKKFGRLYTWNAAQKVCGQGWHLPSSDEFNELKQAAGANPSDALKAKYTWKKNGKNALGFGALAAGLRDESGEFMDATESAYFWTSSEVGNKGVQWFLYYSSTSFARGSDRKDMAMSVRCVKN